MKKSPAFAVIVASAFLTISSTNHVARAQKQTDGVQMQSTNTYAAKFICGVQPQSTISVVPFPDVQAGRYSTKINVHNNTGVPVNFRKKIIPLRSPATPTYDEVTGGGEVPRVPKFTVLESLKEDEAMEVVCQDIYGHLGIKPPPSGDPWRYIEGFVIFEVYYPVSPGKPLVPPPDPLDVEGIYTYKGDLPNIPMASGVSIEVVVYPAKSNSHILH